MKEIHVRKDLRVGERRQNTVPDLASPERRKSDRRTYCWDITKCDAATKQDCYAYISGRNCWDIWALRSPDRKFCCMKVPDCRHCPVIAAKFKDVLYVHLQTSPLAQPAARRSAVCSYLSIDESAQGLAGKFTTLAELLKQDRDVFRCRRRGVHLEANYVSDICASGAHIHCVFLED